MALALAWSDPLYGQEQAIAFTYTEGASTYRGGLVVKLFRSDGANISPVYIAQQPVLDFTGVAAGRGELIVEVSGFNWGSAIFTGKLLILREEIPNNLPGLALGTAPVISLSPDNLTRSRRLEYDVQGAGTGEIVLPLRVQSEGGTVSEIVHRIRIPYRIVRNEPVAPPDPGPVVKSDSPRTVVPDPAMVTQQKAEKEWAQTVERLSLVDGQEDADIAILQAFLKKYPQSPDAEKARNQIGDLKKRKQARTANGDKPKPSQPQTDAETTLWTEIQGLYQKYGMSQRKQILDKCQEYSRKYPGGKYEVKVLNIIEDLAPLDAGVTREGNRFIISLQHAKRPVSYTLTPSGSYADSLDQDALVLYVSLPENRNVRVSIRDGRGETVEKELSTEFDPLAATLQIERDEAGLAQALLIGMRGGKAPYYVQFVPWGQSMAVHEHMIGAPAKSDTVLSISDIQRSLPKEYHLNGPYNLRFTDARKTEQVFLDGMDSRVVIQGGQDANIPGWVWGVLLGLIVAGGGLAFLSRQRAARKREEILRKMGQKSGASVVQTQAPVTPVAPTEQRPRNVGGAIKVNMRQAPEKVVSTGPMLRPFMAEGNDDYCCFNLSETWSNSVVAEVFIHRDCARVLDGFIREHNVDVYRKEMKEDIPEIGGFLLGTIREQEGQYQVSIEKFQPSTSDDQDLYRVSLGMKAWAELDDIMSRYPDLVLVGWFHTHPGHTLFLSQPDLRIQKGFFTKSYQLAMEIDTKTERLDTAFFTWKTDQDINNSKDRQSESWFAWADLETWIHTQAT
ncbi:MAG: hypothetical protein OHK0039_26410 [Bacteroidia bacterium]